MIIEFVGLPGSGKSTQCQLLYDHLKSAGLVSEVLPLFDLTQAPVKYEGDNNQISSVRYATTRARLAIRHFDLLALSAVNLMQRKRPLSERVATFKTVFVSLERYSWGRRAERCSSSSVAIIDEGLAQNAFRLYVEPSGVAESSAISAYFRTTPKSDLIVFIDTPVQTALKRIQLRQRGLPTRLASLPKSDLRRILETAANRLYSLLVLVTDVSTTEVWSVDGSRGENAIHDEIWTFVEQQIRNPDHRPSER